MSEILIKVVSIFCSFGPEKKRKFEIFTHTERCNSSKLSSLISIQNYEIKETAFDLLIIQTDETYQ